MDNRGVESVQELKIRKALEAQAARARRSRTGKGEFDALLKKVAGEVEALRGQADRTTSDGPPEGIQEPEAFREALREAGRNFRHAMKLKKELVEAYKATLEAISQGRDG